MDIQARKIQFVQEFLRVADDGLVTKLEGVLRVERKKKLDLQFHPMTLNELNQSVAAAEEDYKNGRVTEASAVIDQIDSWK